jgi:hypothetical protein
MLLDGSWVPSALLHLNAAGPCTQQQEQEQQHSNDCASDEDMHQTQHAAVLWKLCVAVGHVRQLLLKLTTMPCQ